MMSEVGSQGQSNSPILTEVPCGSPTPPVSGSHLTSRNSSPDSKHSPSPSDLNPTHAPRYGTVIPNRIFVGGIAFNTTEIELKRFFANFGNVKEAKIIADRAGVSKGYGFITFETPEEATRIQQENGDNLIFKDKKLNIGPAVRKQPTYAKTGEPVMSSTNGMIVHHPGYSYTYQNGMAYFHSENQMTPHIPHPAQPPAPSSIYPYSVPVMLPPPPSPQYIPTSQAHQYTAYQQPAPNTPPWSPPAGQWRWIAPPQSPTLPNTSMVPVYASCTPTNEMIYPPNPYQAEMAEIPVPMVEPGQAENAAIPGVDQQAAMNRAYIADVTYQEQPVHASNVIPRVNTIKFNGPRKPFPSRGMRRSQGRGGKAVSSASGSSVTVLANPTRMMDDGKMDTGMATAVVTSPAPEK